MTDPNAVTVTIDLSEFTEKLRLRFVAAIEKAALENGLSVDTAKAISTAAWADIQASSK